MTSDLVIEEGDLEVLRDCTRNLFGGLQSVTVVMAGGYTPSGVGGSELAGQKRDAGDTIDEAVIALTHDLDDFSQSINGSINGYAATEDNAAMSFQQARHDGPVMTVDGLLRMREEQ